MTNIVSILLKEVDLSILFRCNRCCIFKTIKFDKHIQIISQNILGIFLNFYLIAKFPSFYSLHRKCNKLGNCCSIVAAFIVLTQSPFTSKYILT